ncbi:hypothetical protein LXA43DRAFT_971911 [Ganoderma leucocontextum]|nr:hypothetical protein LXA43DRAFT_971911 [Ganoderma leucocontextum]
MPHSSRPIQPMTSAHDFDDPGRCQGCGTLFSQSGLSKHLSQTRKPTCLAFRNLWNAALALVALPGMSEPAGQPPLDSGMDVDPPPSPGLPPAMAEIDMDAVPIQFEGDFFGNYPPEFFDNAEEGPDPSDSSSEEDDDEAVEDGGWEPRLHLRAILRLPPRPPRKSITNIYHPFASRMEWSVAKWAKTRSPRLTSFSELLAIEEVAERLALSFKNSRGLNHIIDNHLPPARSRFQREELVVAGEPQEVFFRDILQCVEALWGDPEFAPILLLVPECHYADTDHTVHKELEREKLGATVIPIIISSDKTQLTLFGNKTAYPIYMTLGNLPKDVRCKPLRCGQILLAYLPTTRLLYITNKATRRRTLANLFHTAMSRILALLASAGVNGIQLISGDGIAHRGHPILATYVGDYPEQVLVTGCKTGESSPEPLRPLRDLEKVLDALAAIDDGPRAFTQACREAGIKPLFLAITPDILHQLYQGVIKHLLAWLQEAYGMDEINVRCCRIPLNHSLRHFAKGISHMSWVTGKEHQDISRILLGLIIGLPLPDGSSPARLVHATRALLDFLYLAQYPTHTSETLALLEEHLQVFHDNKSIFLFGTTDNYDTQYSERLHIDFAKDAYRASNKKEELVQMTVWLEQKEKIQRHEKYIEWRLKQPLPSMCRRSLHPPLILLPIYGNTAFDSHSSPHIYIARHPLVKGVSFDDVKVKYGATYIRDALTCYVVTVNHPDLTRLQVERQSASIYFPFKSIPVYNKVKLLIEDPDGLAVLGTGVRDVIHSHATQQKKGGGEIGGHFNTVLIRDHQDGASGSKPSFIVARVRVIFKIPQRGMAHLFPGIAPEKRPQHLAYVELFMSLNTKHPNHGLYKVNPAYDGDGRRLGLVIPIDDIVCSCHLIPDFGPVAPRDWTSSNVLDQCTAFYLNTFADCNTYKLIY